MIPIYKILQLVNDVDGICEAQGSGQASPVIFNLNGAFVSNGVATLPNVGDQSSQIVTVTAAGADAGAIFTINGTDISGHALTEDVTLVSSAGVETVNFYATVTSVIYSGGSTPLNANVTVGWTQDGDAITAPLVVNYDQAPPNITLAMAPFSDPTATNTALGTIQYSLDDPEDTTRFPSYNNDAFWRSPSDFVNPGDASLGLAVATDGALVSAVRAVRGVIQGGGAGGGDQWRYTVIQGQNV